MAEMSAQSENNMASYAEATKQYTYIRYTDSVQLGGVKPIFILESDVLGKSNTESGLDNGNKNLFLVPTEVYKAVGQHINVSNMIGLQRVRGLWRLYLDNQEDRELLLSSGLELRNKLVTLYTRNPRYSYKEKNETTKVRVKDVPLSADDGQIIKALEDHDCEILNFFRERLRIDNYLTNCQSGDRIFVCKPIETPLPRSLVIGKYRATILHYGQPKPWAEKIKCSKCLGNGHKANECELGWRCRMCGALGHKQSECRKESFSDHGDDSSSESETMENGKKEDHVDDQDDVINNSQDEEEEHAQKAPIGSHDKSRKTEAMDGKLEQSQSILDAKSEEDKPTETMKKQQHMTQYLNEKLAENTNSLVSSKSTPKKKKGRSGLLEKSPITPPEVLHDKEREKGAKKAKKTGR